MSKYIVCSGCSFTRQEYRLGFDGDDEHYMADNSNMWRWPHWIQKLYPKKKTLLTGETFKVSPVRRVFF